MSAPHTHADFIGPLTPAEARLQDLFDREAERDLARELKEDRKASKAFKRAKKEQAKQLKAALEKKRLADIKNQTIENALALAAAGFRRAIDGLDDVAGREIPEPAHMGRAREAMAGVEERAAATKKPKTREAVESARVVPPPPQPQPRGLLFTAGRLTTYAGMAASMVCSFRFGS